MYIVGRKPVPKIVMDLMCFPSSCLALNDLIRGRQADDLIEHLREIWETLFRVLDDIKVSMQNLQSGLVKVLSHVDKIDI